MIDSRRISAIMRSHHLDAKKLQKLLQLSQSKISKIVTGNQQLPSTAVGILIKEFEIYPNWLFGYEGNPDEVMYTKDLVSMIELEKKDKENQDLKLELGQVYKQLAELMKERLKEKE
jgi:hypothetical protein